MKSILKNKKMLAAASTPGPYVRGMLDDQMLTKISDDNFHRIVVNPGPPFVLLFSSPWCTTCKKVMSHMESLSEKCNFAQFGKIDITTNTEKPSEFEVLSIPSIIIFKDGEEKDRIAGEISEQKLKEKIEKIV